MEIENKDFSELSLDELFGISDSDDSDSTAEDVTEVTTDVTETTEQEDTTNTEINMTKAMSERINEVKQKTKDNVAKELGFDDYNDLMAHKTKEDFSDVGIDIEDPDVKSAIDKIVNDKISNDPRFKKLEEFEEREKTSFLKSQLDEINAIEGSSYTSLDQLPKETIDMFGKLGNLKQAYYATQGEKIFAKQANGSTAHLSNKNVSSIGTKTRYLTDDEKDTYRLVLGDSITEEELNKITKQID